MATISINMKFWDDGQKNSTRIRNVLFCWRKLENLYEYLTANGVSVKAQLYDFSETKIMNNAFHIPYPIGTYKKAEKTNLILKEQQVHKFFMMVDSDAFFDYEDYPNILETIKNLSDGDIITFDLAKLNENINDYIIAYEFHKNKADWSYAYSGDRSKGPLNGHSGGLGGVYICDTNLLISLGGFDEKFIGWGGEDGDMLSRIYYSSIPYTLKPIRHYAPYHLPHFADWGNSLYCKRF